MKSNESRASDFIGRQHELAVLAAALDDALSGRGQMVMLAGEPGIGKTRLAQELASRAESLGAQVMWGWCYEHAGAPPYWPYAQPIRAYIESADAQQLSSQMGPGGVAIAEIIPELRAKLPDLGQPIAAEPEQARFRLFDSVSTFLKNLAQSQPLLFVVDDLHWADSSSLLMLEFLVREIAASPVLILGTYRDVEVTATHPLSQTLGNLVRERHYRRVQLGGLTQQEVGEFVEGHKGVNLSGDILETIHSRTEGNPLFVNEVVELIDPEQMAENTAWANIIPEGVRDAIGSRLSRLSPSCNQFLGTASVIGREFDFSLLRTLDSDTGADGLLAALDEALEAKVIEELPGSVGRYQFGHALIQHSLYGELSSVRRLQAHASIGEALEQMHGSNLAEHAAELTRHFAEAQSLLGPKKLSRYSLMAGERALASYAYEDALTHLQRGLAARDVSLPRIDAAADDETAALLFGLAQAQSALQNGEAMLNLKSAFDFYADSGNVDRVVEIVSFPDYGTGTRSAGMGDMIRRALEMVPSDSYEAGRLLPRFGQYVGLQENDYAGAETAFENALAIARRETDPELELQILSAAMSVDSNHIRSNECLEHSVRALALASQVNDPRSELGARYSAVTSLVATGDVQRAAQIAGGMLEPAERLRDSFWLAGSYWKNEVVCRLTGDWETAREFAKRGLSVSSNPSLLLQDMALLEFEVGNFSVGQTYLDQLVESADSRNSRELVEFSSMALANSALALSLAARTTNNLERLELAESMGGIALASNVPPAGTVRARMALAVISVLRDDPAAAEHYDALVPWSGICLFQTMASDRFLGLLSQTVGNLNLSEGHFDNSLSFCRKAGYRPELAWTCYDYADMLLERNGEGDLTKAMLLLDEALAISSELGMRPLMERVGAPRERAEAQPVRAPAYPDGLTQREAEVIRLVAAGKTDREIAEELIISVNTVGNHVRSILNKTNAANRTEAATYAVRRGLSADEDSVGG